VIRKHLPNKTINSASNTITITESNISDLGSYITASSTDTLTNKSINLTNNTLSGTTAEFNTALSDGSFATYQVLKHLQTKQLIVLQTQLQLLNQIFLIYNHIF
jgi:hypothetical protein